MVEKSDGKKKNRDGAKNKKRAKRVVSVLAVLAVLVVAAYIAVDRLSDGKTEYETVTVTQIEEKYPSINPYKADYNKDLSSYEPIVMYTFADGNSFTINDVEESERNEAQRFFLKYFDVLKKGGEGYSSLFTNSYKKDPKGFEKEFDRTFPPQKLYDITVRELLRSTRNENGEEYTYEGKKCMFGYYIVSYKINENDGLFRRDLYSEEVERPLIFELVTFGKGTDNEETYIKNLYTESSISAERSNS